MSPQPLNRRDFLRQTLLGTAAGLAIGSGGGVMGAPSSARPLFRISLAEWSLHRALFQKGDNKLDHLDFAKIARETFGINAIEYVNQFFFDKAKDTDYLGEMKKRAEDQGVRSLLIMVDREGRLGDPDDAKRLQAVENHKKWVEAAAFLGCHSVRVNAASSGSWEDQVSYAANGLRQLTNFAEEHNLYVIVENHGGLSSNGKWLAEVMQTVDHPHCGTLPDFGNFRIDGEEWYDRYQGVAELMPFAKAVSAKTYDFDEQGNETHTDYLRMMKIVLDHDYHGFVGIEYEGKELDEFEGIRRSKALLERVRDELASTHA